MARVYEQDTSRDVTLRATLDITDKDGHSVKKKFVLSRIGSFGNGKILVRFTDPAELRGVKLLSVNQPGMPDQQWIYTPATERVRSISPRERMRAFLRAVILRTKILPSTLLTILPTSCCPPKM